MREGDGQVFVRGSGIPDCLPARRRLPQCRISESGVAGRLRDGLDPHDERLASRGRYDSPELALTVERVADGWRTVLAGGDDLEVTVGVMNVEDPIGHGSEVPMVSSSKPTTYTSSSRRPTWWRRSGAAQGSVLSRISRAGRCSGSTTNDAASSSALFTHGLQTAELTVNGSGRLTSRVTATGRRMMHG